MDTFEPHSNDSLIIATRPDGSQYLQPRFPWDGDRIQAAYDLADGTYRLSQIARRANCSPQALSEWRKNPEFAAKVEECRKEFAALVRSYGLARKETRIQHAQTLHDKLCTVIEERGQAFAKSETLCDVPGGSTGLVYEHVTAHGTEFLVDNKTPVTMDNLRKSIAIEVGEWNEGTTPSVAVQIVCPASAPSADSAPTITIGKQ
jgi:transposase-like protein